MVMDWHQSIAWDTRSSDIRAIQHQVAGHLKPFRLTPVRGGTALCRARFFHRSVGGLSLCVIGYGREVLLDAGQLGNFSILHRPLTGHYVVEGRAIHAGEAHLIAPGEPVVMEWSADCLLLVVRFPAQAATELGIEATRLRDLQGRGERIVLDLAAGAGLSLARALDFSLLEAGREGLLGKSRLATRAAEALVLAAIRDVLQAPRRAPGNQNAAGPVERAEAFMLHHIREPITLADVAKAAGVASRTISDAFRRHHDVGVIEWLRLRRLDRIYEELARADGAPRTVTDVATFWGFSHLSRLSSAYARRFGEQPRRTLTRARAKATSVSVAARRLSAV